MKTPIVIIAIMLCFNVLSQAQTTPNRGQELKEQAQNSLSQKDYIKARYLFKKAYEVFAAREDYPQANSTSWKKQPSLLKTIRSMKIFFIQRPITITLSD